MKSIFIALIALCSTLIFQVSMATCTGVCMGPNCVEVSGRLIVNNKPVNAKFGFKTNGPSCGTLDGSSFTGKIKKGHVITAAGIDYEGKQVGCDIQGSKTINSNTQLKYELANNICKVSVQ